MGSRRAAFLGEALIAVLVVLGWGSCFGPVEPMVEMEFRLAADSDALDLETVQVLVYEESARTAVANLEDPRSACRTAVDIKEFDAPIYEQQFLYSSRGARLLITSPARKFNLVLEGYRSGRDQARTVAARGVKSGVWVDPDGVTDAGEIKLVRTLDRERPAGVSIQARTGRVEIEFDGVEGATDYIACVGTSETDMPNPVVFTVPTHVIREMTAPRALAAAPLENGTTYYLKVYARNEGSLSLPFPEPGSPQPADGGSTAGREGALGVAARPQLDISSVGTPKFTRNEAEINWIGAEGATGYCLDSECLSTGSVLCEENLAEAHANLKDEEVRCVQPVSPNQRCLLVSNLRAGQDCRFDIFAVNDANGLSDPRTLTFVFPTPK